MSVSVKSLHPRRVKNTKERDHSEAAAPTDSINRTALINRTTPRHKINAEGLVPTVQALIKIVDGWAALFGQEYIVPLAGSTSLLWRKVRRSFGREYTRSFGREYIVLLVGSTFFL